MLEGSHLSNTFSFGQASALTGIDHLLPRHYCARALSTLLLLDHPYEGSPLWFKVSPPVVRSARGISAPEFSLVDSSISPFRKRPPYCQHFLGLIDLAAVELAVSILPFSSGV